MLAKVLKDLHCVIVKFNFVLNVSIKYRDSDDYDNNNNNNNNNNGLCRNVC